MQLCCFTAAWVSGDLAKEALSIASKSVNPINLHKFHSQIMSNSQESLSIINHTKHYKTIPTWAVEAYWICHVTTMLPDNLPHPPSICAAQTMALCQWCKASSTGRGKILRTTGAVTSNWNKDSLNRCFSNGDTATIMVILVGYIGIYNQSICSFVTKSCITWIFSIPLVKKRW